MRTSRNQNISSEVFATPGTTHGQNTISSTAKNVIDVTMDATTEQVFLQVTGDQLRVTFDGVTDPTATKGVIYSDGDVALWSKTQAKKAKGIRVTADVVVEFQELAY